MPTWAKVIGGIVLALTVYGVFVGIFMGGFPSIWTSGRESDWSWWQYALAIPALGLLALGGDAIGHVIFAPFRWGGRDESPWKRAVFIVLVFVVGVALLVGPWWILTHQG